MPEKPQITVDWTIDPATGRTNSSPEFVKLVAEVERLIRGDAFKLIAGCADQTAGLIMAQLVHVHGLAPQKAEVQSVESDEKGVLHGTFAWNGVVYQYRAEPLP